MNALTLYRSHQKWLRFDWCAQHGRTLAGASPATSWSQ